jgi:hypothetical protein
LAKLPPFRRFIQEDFPQKYNDLITGLFYGLNQFFESVSNALNGNITFSENISAQIQEITIVAPINAQKTVSFRRTLRGQCQGVWIVNVDNLDDANTQLSNAPFVQFTNGQDTIIINNITGLTDGTRYRLRLICVDRL